MKRGTLNTDGTISCPAAIQALTTACPGMSPVQAWQLLAAAQSAPQFLLVDRPPAEIAHAAAVLRPAGVYFDVV